MRRFELSDEQWERVQGLLPGRLGSPGRSAKDNRLFLARGLVDRSHGRSVA